MKVKILAIPRNRQEVIPISPFENPYAEQQSKEMKYGGELKDGTKYGSRRVDTKWDWMNQLANTTDRDNPYFRTGNTLPEAAPGEADINAEKEEKIMGDFNGDGMPVLMNVGGPPHTQGGKNLSVPKNSFVFSDTKNLAIKDPSILAQFGGGTKPKTPADLATKYKLQEYKKVIDDPQSDELDKKTAVKNYTNAVNKLNALASYQEEMKNKAKPSFPGQAMIGRYGGALPDFMQGGGKAGYDVSPYGQNSTGTSDQPIVYPEEVVKASRPDFNTSNTGYRQMPTDVAPYNSGTMNLGIGSPRIEGPDVVPYSPDTMDLGAGLPDIKGRFQLPQVPGTNPDQMRNYINALKALSYPAGMPIRRTSNYAIPNPVFLDPTRAKAAAMSSGNQAAYNAATSGRGPISRANALASSGKVGEQAADIEGKYQNENAGIANSANRNASELFNKSWEQQQLYNREYNEDITNRNKDIYGAHAAFDNEYLKALYEDENKKRNFAWDNVAAMENRDPYLVDQRGMPVRNNYWGDVNSRMGTGQNTGNGDYGASQAAAIYASFKAKGFNDSDAIKFTQDYIKNSRTKQGSK